MMTNRPFALLIALLVALPLVLDDLPSLGAALRGIELAPGGATLVMVALLSAIAGAAVARRSSRNDVEA
jgi:hypothetical protein